MGHKSQYATCGVGDSRYVAFRAVRIPGVVDNCIQMEGLDSVENCFILSDEASLAVADWNIHILESLGPYAWRIGIEADIEPAVLKHSCVVVDKGNLLSPVAVKVRKNSHFDKDLEAVADSDYQLALGNELVQYALQVLLEQMSHNQAAAKVITEGEATGET